MTCFNITIVAGLFSSIFESLSSIGKLPLTYKLVAQESSNVPIRTRFSKKFDLWCWIWVGVVFVLSWCDVVQSLEFDHPILFRLDAYAWFEEVEHVMFLKLESWKKALYLQRRFNLRGKLKSWKKVCIFKEASIFEGDRLQKLGSLLALERILLRPSRIKKFQPLKMRRTPLFIEFSGGLCGLEHGWSIEQTHEFNYVDLSYI